MATVKNDFGLTFRVEKLTEVIADLRQPPMTDTTQIPASVEDSQFSSNLSYLDLREDPDTLLRYKCRPGKLHNETSLQPVPSSMLGLSVTHCVRKVPVGITPANHVSLDFPCSNKTGAVVVNSQKLTICTYGFSHIYMGGYWHC